MTTKVTNIRWLRKNEWPPHHEYVGREGWGFDGYFGNPKHLRRNATMSERVKAVAEFKEYFLRRVKADADYRARVEELRGKTLVCFCHPLPCHGDVIAEYLNQTETKGADDGRVTEAVRAQDREDVQVRRRARRAGHRPAR